MTAILHQLLGAYQQESANSTRPI